MLVEGLTAQTLDADIRGAGWHFMWMVGSCCRLGYGWTAEGAERRALKRALRKQAEQFNASEIDSVVIKKYPGFFRAKVILHPRLIQQSTSLDMRKA
jgi:hypothetical protein